MESTPSKTLSCLWKDNLKAATSFPFCQNRKKVIRRTETSNRVHCLVGDTAKFASKPMYCG